MSETHLPEEGEPATAGQFGRREFLKRTALATSGLWLAGLGWESGAAWARSSGSKINVLYLSQSPSEIKVVENYSALFTRESGIRVDVSPIGYDAFNRSFPLALRAHTAADVAYGNSGISTVTQFGDEGFLVDLGPLAQKYGWSKRISPDIIAYANYPEKRIWTIPYDLVTVGNYYNQNIFDKLHITKAPTTFAGYEALLAKLKSSGLVPIALGGKDYNPSWIFDQLTHTSVPWPILLQLNRGYSPKAYWPQAGFVRAATILQDWARKGYFQANALGMSTSPDAENFFLNGQSAMIIDGSWNNFNFVANAKFPVRFFATPRLSTKVPYHMGGYTPNNDWMIPKAGKNIPAAEKYLDFVLGEQAAMALWRSGDIVAYKFKTAPKAKARVQADVYAAMQKTRVGSYGTGPASMNTDLIEIFQELISDRVTPAEAMSKLHDAYIKATKNKR